MNDETADQQLEEAPQWLIKEREDEERAELEELRQYKQQAEQAKQQAEQAKEHEKIVNKVSKTTGIPVELLSVLPGDTTEETLNEFAYKLDQFAHPKPQGLPNQGAQPQGTFNTAFADMTRALFKD